MRRTLHFRAGEALRDTSPPPLVRLARHYRNAGDVTRWSAYAEQAAAAALAAGGDGTAATTLHDLITTTDLPAPDLVRLARALPMGSLRRQGGMVSLVAALRTALDRDGPDPTDARTRWTGSRPATARTSWTRPTACRSPGARARRWPSSTRSTTRTPSPTYRSTYGLPPCTVAGGCLTKLNQDGVAGDYLPADGSWSLEISSSRR
jgi:hypothetical protein